MICDVAVPSHTGVETRVAAVREKRLINSELPRGMDSTLPQFYTFAGTLIGLLNGARAPKWPITHDFPFSELVIRLRTISVLELSLDRDDSSSGAH